MVNAHNESTAATLDFYSDRAEAHASFFVASVFGVFTVLSIVSSNTIAGTARILWSFPYWVLFLFGLYSLLNFFCYATMAERIKQSITSEDIFDFEYTISNLYLLAYYSGFKTELLSKIRKTPVMIFLYFVFAGFSYLLGFYPDSPLFSWLGSSVQQQYGLISVTIIALIVLGFIWLYRWLRRTKLIMQFWQRLLEMSKEKGEKYFRYKVAGYKPFLIANAGRTGLRYHYGIAPPKRFVVSLRIRTGSLENNRKIYEQLEAHKQETNRVFGRELKWTLSGEVRDFPVIYHRLDIEDCINDRKKWDVIANTFLEAMMNLEKAFETPIKKLVY